MRVSEEERSVRDGVYTCSSSEVSRTRTIYSTDTHTSDCAVFPGEVLSGGDGVPREQVLQQSSEFSGEVG